jgi:hypothetical protein
VAPPDDPIRAEVESRLRAIVGAALGAPACIRRCVERRVGQPLQLVRSWFEAASRPVTTPVVTTSPVTTRADAVDSDGDADSEVSELPIDHYESLAAGHVVARLGTLTPAELRQVRRFEAAHRGRRTVLGKIDQLLAPA